MTGTSDADLLESPSADIGLIPLQSLDIDLAGIGLVEAVHKTYFFVNRSASLAGFLDQLDGDFIDLAAPDFKTYDGVTGAPSLPVDLDYAGTLSTSAGTLAISDMTAFLTVTGINAEVPEPNTAALMAIACAAIAATRRKSQRESFLRWLIRLQQVPLQFRTVQRQHPVAFGVGEGLSCGQPALPPRLIDFLFQRMARREPWLPSSRDRTNLVPATFHGRS